MASSTGIGWTEATWNPWYGCAKVSPGCENCYMFKEMRRYGRDPEVVMRSKTKFDDPLRWVRSGKPPKYCFTCSWSDFFIAAADQWRDGAWEIIRKTPQITYQILTKRVGRIALCLPEDWGFGYKNVWLGVSVEGPDQLPRIHTLQQVQARTRFVSFEPLLGDITANRSLDLLGIDWAIIGGESGPKARPMELKWARNLKLTCQEQDVKLFVKQLGGVRDKRDDITKFPADLQIQEYPEAPDAH